MDRSGSVSKAEFRTGVMKLLRHADHYVRFIYPCSYALVIAMWSWSWSAGE